MQFTFNDFTACHNHLDRVVVVKARRHTVDKLRPDGHNTLGVIQLVDQVQNRGSRPRAAAPQS